MPHLQIAHEEETVAKKMNRRDFMRLAGGAAAGTLLAACQPKTVLVEKEVEVEKEVTRVVKETVVVEGTPKIVEKLQQVTKVVQEIVTATPVPALPEVTLKIMLPGDRPKQMEGIIAIAEAKMAAKGINAKLDVTFVPWGADLQNISVAMAAGEEIDLAFDAPWLNIEQNIAQGFYVELDDILAEYGPNVLNARPNLMWEANKFKDKIFGIPLGFSHYQGRSWLIRKDMREEMGFPDLMDEPLVAADWDQFVEFLYATKDAFPDMIPMSGNWTHQLFADFDTSLRGVSAPDFRALYRKGNDGVVYNLFDDPDPLVMGYIDQWAQFRKDGIIPQEAATGSEYKIEFGKVASASVNDFGISSQVAADVESLGGETEWITFMPADKKRIVNFQQWNFICVPYTSPNPERAIMFLNWAHEKENYDLLAYGIEGQNWEAVGETEYTPSAEDPYRWYPYAWVWNPTHERLNADAAEFANDWNRWSMDADNFEGDVLIGWNPNDEPVLNEVSQLEALHSQYYGPLNSGLVDDVEAWWAEYEREAADLMRTVADEYNSQIDEFLGR
jgi:putative aldouronate transport system substrate-binding protein